MRKHWLYLKYVVRHKWFVFVAGLRVGAPLWRLLIHDWSKFLPSEWRAYARFFYGAPEGFCMTCHAPLARLRKAPRGLAYCRNTKCQAHDELRASASYIKPLEWHEAFDRAWLKHQHRNAHHWQHWVIREDQGGTKTLEIPEPYVREMVADWLGAGRAITGKWEAAEWYLRNAEKMLLSYRAQMLVEMVLGVKARCSCGAHGSTAARCRLQGYCEAHSTDVPGLEEVASA
jgi:hypothetical protein